MEIISIGRPDHQIVRVTGRIDVSEAPRLREGLLWLLHVGDPRMVLDLRPAGDLPADTLFVVMGTCRRATLLGGWLRLVCGSRGRRMLRDAGLAGSIACYRDVESAVSDHAERTPNVHDLAPGSRNLVQAPPATASGW